MHVMQQECTPFTIHAHTASLPTNIVDFDGFDSSIILVQRGGLLISIGDSPGILSQAILVGCDVSREIGRASREYVRRGLKATLP